MDDAQGKREVCARGEIIAHFDSGPRHRILRLRVPTLAAAARPGHRLRLPHNSWPLLRADAKAGWLEVLYPVEEDPALARTSPGETIPLTLRQETAFHQRSAPLALLLGDNLGIAPILFLSLTLATSDTQQMVLLGSDEAFPFRPHPSRLMVPRLPGQLIATLPLLEERGIACRLAHTEGSPGCFEGGVVELASLWLETLSEQERNKVQIYGCCERPTAVSEIETLAQHFGLEPQIGRP